jgi:hypothetical protein
MESYAIKRALQLQSDGQIFFTPISENNIEASYPPVRQTSYLILFSTKDGPKDRK